MHIFADQDSQYDQMMEMLKALVVTSFNQTVLQALEEYAGCLEHLLVYPLGPFKRLSPRLHCPGRKAP